MSKFLLPLAFISLILGGGVPFAATTADPTPIDKNLIMSKIDTDGDGTISLDEAKAAAAAKFDALDTDEEGTLDVNELAGIVARGTVTKADRDKDGTLDKAEFLALVEKLFMAADHEHDGKIDIRELATEQGRALVALLQY